MSSDLLSITILGASLGQKNRRFDELIESNDSLIKQRWHLLNSWESSI